MKCKQRHLCVIAAVCQAMAFFEVLLGRKSPELRTPLFWEYGSRECLGCTSSLCICAPQRWHITFYANSFRTPETCCHRSATLSILRNVLLVDTGMCKGVSCSYVTRPAFLTASMYMLGPCWIPFNHTELRVESSTRPGECICLRLHEGLVYAMCPQHLEYFPLH
jgi:hypothetical protein